MCSISWGFLCLHIRRFLCYTAKNSKIVSYSFAVATYPREGTETSDMKNLCPQVQLQLIPARGRKRCPCHDLPSRRELQLIPARGRKLRRVAILNEIPNRCNLSPRGDGNFFIAAISSTCLEVATYPREGTETDGWPVECVASWNVATYPREGTETALYPLSTGRALWLQLIPARGRKRPRA